MGSVLTKLNTAEPRLLPGTLPLHVIVSTPSAVEALGRAA
jgi:hypothetical protein